MSEWKNIDAAQWIDRLPESRQGLCAGCKIILQALWDHVSRGIQRDTEHAESPWVSAETLAELRGSKSETVQARLDKLTALGWVRRVNGRRLLAWSRPFDSAPGLKSRVKSGLKSLPSPGPHQDSNPHVPGLESDASGIQVPTSQYSNTDNQGIQEKKPNQEQEISRARDSASPAKRRRPRSSRDQVALAIPGANPPAPAGMPPDDAQAVADRLRLRQAQVREALSMPKPGQSVLDAKRRSKINARINEHGLEACFRVIDVDAAECQAQGQNGKSWSYWNLDTPFSDAANFERRLNRWRADGNHVVWGVQQPQGASGHRSRGSTMPGQNERLAAAADADNRGRERADAERQAQLEYLRASGKIPRLPEPPVDAADEVSF